MAGNININIEIQILHIKTIFDILNSQDNFFDYKYMSPSTYQNASIHEIIYAVT